MSLPSPKGPPPYFGTAQSPPAAGIRTPCLTTLPFPSLDLLGPAPFKDVDSEPIFVASAIMGQSVHPCKAGPHLQPACRVPFAGEEVGHSGRYDILPITGDMEWVPTSNGLIPEGRHPVEGGYEESGEHLFHALVTMDAEHQVPGKTGVHLGGANIAWGWKEVVVKENYSILCWRHKE